MIQADRAACGLSQRDRQQLRVNLARSRESSDRTVRSPDPRNVCGVTEIHRPVVKLLELIHILALPTKRRRRTVSVWRNQSSAWKKAAKS